MTAKQHERSSPAEGLLRPLAGWLLGPGAWAAHENLSYMIAAWACQAELEWTLHLTTLVLLAVAAAGGLVSWRSFNRLRMHQDSHGRARSRSFLALSGSGIAAFSFLGILVEAIPNYILDPCLRAA